MVRRIKKPFGFGYSVGGGSVGVEVAPTPITAQASLSFSMLPLLSTSSVAALGAILGASALSFTLMPLVATSALKIAGASALSFSMLPLVTTGSVASTAPTVEWTSGTDEFNPAFHFTSPIDEGDVVNVDVDNNSDFSSIFDSGTNTVDATEAVTGNLTFPDVSTLTPGTWHVRFQVNGGAWSTTLMKTLAYAAPVLSSPTDAANGATGATLSVSTDVGDGTLYWYISTSSTPPSAANLKSGSGAVAAGSQAVSGTGVQNASPTGLTANTAYYAHFLHRRAAGVDSAIVSGNGFTTLAAAVGHRAGTTVNITTAGPSHTHANIDNDAGVVLFLCSVAHDSSVTGVTATLDGVSLGSPVAFDGSGGFHTTVAFVAPAAAANADLVITAVGGSPWMFFTIVTPISLTGANSTPVDIEERATSYYGETTTTPNSITVPTGGKAFAVAKYENAGTGATWDVGTELVDIVVSDNRHTVAVLSASGIPTVTAAGGNGSSMVAVSFGVV